MSLWIDKIDLSQFQFSSQSDLNVVLPGDLITSEPGYMHGHGTFEESSCIYSSLVGII